MALTWQYPATATLKIDNNIDSNGYLITDELTTAAGQKTVSLKGFKTPEDDEDANAETSSYRAVATYIYGLFGLEDGLILSTGVSQANANLNGELEGGVNNG